MNTWKILPENLSVAKFIDCYWLLEKVEGDIGPDHPKLNPDPAAHLILSEMQQPYQYAQTRMTVCGQGSHLILPHCQTLSMNHTDPFVVIGIKFHVGALYSLNLTTPPVLLDEIIEGNLIKRFQLEAFNGADRLNQYINQPELCRNYLDDLLDSYVSGIHLDKHSKLVCDILALVPDVTLSTIGAELGCSQRTIERSFSRVTGYGFHIKTILFYGETGSDA